MLIYANGDSLTEGVGLSDHIVFPEYPGNRQLHVKVTDWPVVRDDLSRQRGLVDYLRNENKKRSWPTYLGKILDADVINEAIGGSSIFGILTRTIHDLEQLTIQGRIPDYVLIGLTSKERIPIINRMPDKNNDDRWTYTAHPRYFDHLDPTYRKYAKEYWRTLNDEELLIFFLYHCLHIKNYVKNKIGKDPIFLDTIDFFPKHKNIIENTESPLLKEVWGLLNFNEISSQISFTNINTFSVTTACGHWIEDVHKVYATYIADNLIKSL